MNFITDTYLHLLKGSGYILNCLNSWGEEDREPLIHNREMTDLYFISIYWGSSQKQAVADNRESNAGETAGASVSDSSIVALTSDGSAGEESAVVPLLGLFKEQGLQNEVLIGSSFAFITWIFQVKILQAASLS